MITPIFIGSHHTSISQCSSCSCHVVPSSQYSGRPEYCSSHGCSCTNDHNIQGGHTLYFTCTSLQMQPATEYGLTRLTEPRAGAIAARRRAAGPRRHGAAALRLAGPCWRPLALPASGRARPGPRRLGLGDFEAQARTRRLTVGPGPPGPGSRRRGDS